MNSWGILVHDLIASGVVKNPSFVKKSLALISIGILMMGGMLEDEARKAVNELLSQKEFKDKGHSWLFNAVMNLVVKAPGFGAIGNAVANGGSSSPPAIRVVEKSTKGLYQAFQGKTDDAQLKGLMDVSEGVMTIGLGFPGTAQMYDIVEGMMFKK